MVLTSGGCGYCTESYPMIRRSINGVKDMAGYRQTLNLSFMPSAEGSGNASESCDSDDSVETTAILVSRYNVMV